MKWLKKWIEKRRWKLKLERMDFIWYFYGGSSWQLFPPSYYYTHSPEEVEAETARILNELEAMVLGYKKKLEESKEG
ncbi:MAG: hypothetical protein V8T29_02315 [Oscillospiraceae bacterium]|jgi:hypothetical protein|nr:unknown [Firmicutes bacterium CAG:137]